MKKMLRFVYSNGLSKCCNAKSVLVRSRDGGFISPGCLKCGKPGYAGQYRLPDIWWECCNSNLAVLKPDGTNYFY